MTKTPSHSVCIVTFERPDFLKRCLASLAEFVEASTDVVVVDASAMPVRANALEAYPGVVYVHAPKLAGWMTRARNEALRWARGEVISFIDDDVVVRPEWQAGVLTAMADPSVCAVAGRTCNGIAGEEVYDRPIGRLRPDGTLTAGFAATASGLIDVDHGIGANMTFRRSTLSRLGGFRDDYPGTAMREDTDIFLRVRAMGGRAVFSSDAVVDHLPAPHVRGKRFDTRYKLYGRRNHMVLLAREYGIGSPVLRTWVSTQFGSVHRADGFMAGVKRWGVTAIGVSWGAGALLRTARWRPLPPERRDPEGEQLRSILAGTSEH